MAWLVLGIRVRGVHGHRWKMQPVIRSQMPPAYRARGFRQSDLADAGDVEHARWSVMFCGTSAI